MCSSSDADLFPGSLDRVGLEFPEDLLRSAHCPELRVLEVRGLLQAAGEGAVPDFPCPFPGMTGAQVDTREIERLVRNARVDVHTAPVAKSGVREFLKVAHVRGLWIFAPELW